MNHTKEITPQDVPNYASRDVEVDEADAAAIRRGDIHTAIHHIGGLRGFEWSHDAVVNETVGLAEFARIAVHLHRKGHIETLRLVLEGNWHDNGWLGDDPEALKWAAEDERKAHRILRGNGLAAFTIGA